MPGLGPIKLAYSEEKSTQHISRLDKYAWSGFGIQKGDKNNNIEYSDIYLDLD